MKILTAELAGTIMTFFKAKGQNGEVMDVSQPQKQTKMSKNCKNFPGGVSFVSLPQF